MPVGVTTVAAQLLCRPQVANLRLSILPCLQCYRAGVANQWYQEQPPHLLLSRRFRTGEWWEFVPSKANWANSISRDLGACSFVDCMLFRSISRKWWAGGRTHRLAVSTTPLLLQDDHWGTYQRCMGEDEHWGK